MKIPIREWLGIDDLRPGYALSHSLGIRNLAKMSIETGPLRPVKDSCRRIVP